MIVTTKSNFLRKQLCIENEKKANLHLLFQPSKNLTHVLLSKLKLSFSEKATKMCAIVFMVLKFT